MIDRLNIPTPADIRQAREQLDPYILETPVWHWRNREIDRIVGPETQVFLKLELFQHTGTFKPRVSLAQMLALEPAALKNGVICATAGNHGAGLSYAAAALGVSAKIVMPKTADPARLRLCQAYGAELILVEDISQSFSQVEIIAEAEKRTYIHAFDGYGAALGDATIGLELCRQLDQLDAVIVPIGGGGLCAGIAAAVKQIQPNCQVFGVEPTGANTMYLSFQSGKPEPISAVQTIADSLGSPYALPYSFGLCQHFLDDLVLVDDDDIRRAMLLLYRGAKLVVEPAGATATAALCGPLRERLRGQRIAVLVSGSNTDPDTFASHIAPIIEN